MVGEATNGRSWASTGAAGPAPLKTDFWAAFGRHGRHARLGRHVPWRPQPATLYIVVGHVSHTT